LSDEQAQAGIRSLPDTWEQMTLNMMHNEKIKTFDDLLRHLELEAKRLEVVKANGSSYTAQSGSRKLFGSKLKKNQGGKNENSGPAPEKANSTKRKRSKRDEKGKTSIVCFNCGKKGHFAHDCTVPKKVLSNLSSLSFCYKPYHGSSSFL